MNRALLNAFKDPLVTSMEDLGESAGVTELEREYEIYGVVEDLDALKEKAARFEYQEQWGLPCDAGKEAGVCGSIRVRKTKEGEDGDEKYTMAIKVAKEDGKDENEMEITAEAFEIFTRLVPTCLKKTRYIFPVKGTEFELEVDVFQDVDGNPINHVKIDLEVDEGTDVNSVTMPFVLTEPRMMKPGKKSDEDLAYVKDLFANKYEIKNPLHAVAESEEEPLSDTVEEGSEEEPDTDLPEGEELTDEGSEEGSEEEEAAEEEPEESEEDKNAASIN